MADASTKRRVNFGTDVPLRSISEGKDGEEADSITSDDLGLDFMRHHSIQAIVSAKSASKIFKARALMAKKNKKRDDGLVEVILFQLLFR